MVTPDAFDKQISAAAYAAGAEHSEQQARLLTAAHILLSNITAADAPNRACLDSQNVRFELEQAGFMQGGQSLRDMLPGITEAVGGAAQRESGIAASMRATQQGLLADNPAA